MTWWNRHNGTSCGKWLPLPALFLLAAGCQTTTVTSGGALSTPTNAPVVKTAPPQPAFTGNAIEAFDPCGDRMEDLCGPLIFFYKQHGRGPERLEELQPFAIPGQLLKFTCPVSGKPYVCAPDGLSADGQDIRIYIYDAEPVHHGARWCAVKKNGAMANQPEIMYSVLLPEEKFRRFRLVPSQLPIQ